MDKIEIIKKWNKIIDGVLEETIEYKNKVTELQLENIELLDILAQHERKIKDLEEENKKLQDLMAINKH